MKQITFASRSILSFATFNAGWWVCALGPRYNMEWIGPASMPIWVGLHLMFTPVRKGEAFFLAALGAVGFLIDTALIYGGVFSLSPPAQVTPPWLVCMWILLGITFESMLIMRRRFYLICLMGVVSGPLSYLFAQAVNILNYAEPKWIMITIHAALWAALMPLLFSLRDLVVGATLPLPEHHVHLAHPEKSASPLPSLPEEDPRKVSRGRR